MLARDKNDAAENREVKKRRKAEPRGKLNLSRAVPLDGTGAFAAIYDERQMLLADVRLGADNMELAVVLSRRGSE